jgi:Ni,Fe-hydrogenase III small subunit
MSLDLKQDYFTLFGLPVSYAVEGAVANVIPVDLHIRGCPPRPVQLLEGLLRLLEPNAKVHDAT